MSLVDKQKFVIFGHARSGSTSLARVLGESSDVKMAIEPFHPKYSQWNPKERNYSEFIKDVKTMDFALNEVFSKYSSVKVLDYQLPKKLYFRMIDRADLKIIFLRRKNLVDAAISTAVAERTGEWHERKDKIVYENLKPLDVEEIRKWVDYVGGLSDTYLSYLKKNKKGGYVQVFYEELYLEGLERTERELGKICKFLGVEIPPDSVIDKYMLPKNSKINYKNIYEKI